MKHRRTSTRKRKDPKRIRAGKKAAFTRKHPRYKRGSKKGQFRPRR